MPLLCAIDGPALGGGLEWALWCDYRICTDSPKTKLGLPEVKLGLVPGFGGTQNLHKLVGLQKAMDMMLTGKDIRPAEAKKMGLVDMVVAPASLEKVAMETARGLAGGSIKKSKGKKKKSWMDWTGPWRIRPLGGISCGRRLTKWFRKTPMESTPHLFQLSIRSSMDWNTLRVMPSTNLNVRHLPNLLLHQSLMP